MEDKQKQYLIDIMKADEELGLYEEPKQKNTLEEAAKKYRKTTPNQMFGDELGFIDGAKWQQERLCNSQAIQRIRASKSDAEARRIIRTI